MTHNMPTQSLSDAIQLYEVLGKYIPDVPSEHYLDYINAILENIKQSGNYRVYMDAIHIMTGERVDTAKQDSLDVLNLFIQSLAEWHIVELVAFFRSVGYKHD